MQVLGHSRRPNEQRTQCDTVLSNRVYIMQDIMMSSRFFRPQTSDVNHHYHSFRHVVIVQSLNRQSCFGCGGLRQFVECILELVGIYQGIISIPLLHQHIEIGKKVHLLTFFSDKPQHMLTPVGLLRRILRSEDTALQVRQVDHLVRNPLHPSFGADAVRDECGPYWDTDANVVSTSSQSCNVVVIDNILLHLASEDRGLDADCFGDFVLIDAEAMQEVVVDDFPREK